MRRLVTALLCCMAAQAGAAQPETDVPRYYEQFDPHLVPWQAGQELNFEEVFKNYQYFELRFAPGGDEFEVLRHVRNQAVSRERYRIRKDGSLERLPP